MNAWLLVASALAVWQTPPATAQQDTASRYVLTTVAGPHNEPLTDLGPDDFVVNDGDRVREVLSVHLADYPIAVLVDTGGEASRDFDLIRSAAARFITRLGQRPVTVGTLGEQPAMLTRIEDERADVEKQLGAVQPAPAGGTMLVQGVANAAEQLLASGSLFSAIVVISATAADDSKNAEQDLLATVMRSGALVYGVGNRTSPLTPAGPAGRTVDALRDLATETRGQMTTIYTASSFQAALDHLADRLSTELMVEYLVPPGTAARDVKVGVRIPGAKAKGLGVAPR